MRRALIVATLAVAVTAWGQSQRDEVFEKRVLEQLQATHPELLQEFEKATAAMDAGQMEEAVVRFRSITQSALDFSPAHRRLCASLSSLKRFDEATSACEQAVSLEASFENEQTRANLWRERNGPGDAERVKQWAVGALRTQPVGSDSWRETKWMQCWAEYQGSPAAGRSCADEFLAASPEDPFANYLAVEAAASRGEWSQAFECLEKARAVLPDEEYQRLHSLLSENEPLHLRWGIPWLKVVTGWFLVFGGLVVLGLVLSSVTLVMARKLSTAREERSSAGARLLRSLYRGIVAVGSVFYYVSLPLVVLTVLLLGGGLIYAFLVMGRIPIKLVMIIGLLVLATLFAILKSLFVRVRDADPGEKLDWSQAPRLRTLLEEVAARVGTRPVDSVYLTPGTEVAVFERGGLLKRLSGQTERCLILGLGVLDGFQVRPFKSVLAHEYGHFSNKDTAGGNLALGARRSLMRMGMALAESGAAGWYNPAWLFFRGYYAVFLRISQGASRLQEVLADRLAIFTYGSQAFQDGYRHVIRQSVRFHALTQSTLQEVIDAKRGLTNVYRFSPASPPRTEELETAFQTELDAEPSPYDSHPSSKDRLAWASALDIPGTPGPGDEDGVWSLFDAREQLEKRMTAIIKSNVLENHGVEIPDESAT
jgi:Zn-dependent protease with chaperone function